MKIEIHHYHHLDAKNSAKLSQITRQYFSIEKELKIIQETLRIIMKQQQKIDALTEQVLNNTVGVKDAIAGEAAEIKAAIENSDVDTTGLEAALAENAGLAKLVNDIYTDAGEAPPIAVTENADAPTGEAPTGEDAAGETATGETPADESSTDETSTGEDAAADSGGGEEGEPSVS